MATFYAMSSSTATSPISTSSSMFAAINAAAANSGTSSCVRNGSATGAIVWQKTTASSPKFYEYQYQGYYGSVATDADAKQWSKSYNYSHLITGHPYQHGGKTYKAFPVYEYLQNVKGDIANSSDSGLIERNEGGYYYNFSTSSQTYRRVSAIFDMTSATFKLPNINQSGTRPHNAWMFVGIKQTGGYTCEAGFAILTDGANPTIALYPYLKTFSSPTYHYYSPYALTNSGGVYSYGDSVKVTLTIAQNGQFSVIFDDFKSGTVQQASQADSAASTTAAHRWFAASSLVSYYSSHNELFDMRSGFYSKNVKIRNSFVYTTATSTAGISFAPDTSLSQYAYLYNTDCASRTATGSGAQTVETISCFYDR
jgi:hypothetical protein